MLPGQDSAAIKVMLKAKFVHILFSQIHQNYAKYTFETFTVDGINISCLSDRKYSLNMNVLHMHNFSEKPVKK